MQKQLYAQQAGSGAVQAVKPETRASITLTCSTPQTTRPGKRGYNARKEKLQTPSFLF